MLGQKKRFYLPMGIYRELGLLKYYLNDDNDEAIPINDEDKIDKETSKDTETESVDSFVVHSEPPLGISTE